MQNETSQALCHKIIKTADELNQRGRPEAAAEILRKCIEQAPHEPDFYYALIEILIESEAYQQALQVVAAFPTEDVNIKCAELKIECLEKLQRFDEAEEVADQVLRLDSNRAPALNLKGVLLYQKQEKQAAQIFFERSIQSDPTNGRAYMNLGLLNLENSQHPTALDLLAKGFALAPQMKEVANTFHEVVSELGAFAEVESMFRDACRRYPQNKRLFYLLVDIFIQQNKLKDAMAVIETCLAAFGVEDGILAPALKIRRQLGLKTIDPEKKAVTTVSLCMIAKDEEDNLARCLESVKEAVDEIVVVDTGSCDKTADIALLFGAKVYICDWHDDFSEARNFALSKAVGQWIFILDADETVSRRDHKHLINIAECGSDLPVAYSFVTRNYTDDVGTEGWQANDGQYFKEQAASGWYPSEKVRMFTNDDRIRFENPVHELVEPSLRQAGIQIRKCPVPIHHYGTVRSNKAATPKNKYYSLGRKKVTAKQSDPAALFEHAVQAQESAEYEEALKLWEEVLKYCPNLAKAYFNMSYCYIQLERYREGTAASRRALDLDPGLKEATLNFALCRLRSGEIESTISMLEDFLHKIPDHPLACGLLAVAYCLEGQGCRGIELFDKLQKMGFNCLEYITEHAQKMVAAGRRQDAVLFLQALAASHYAVENLRMQLLAPTSCRLEFSPLRIHFCNLNNLNQHYRKYLKPLEAYSNLDEHYFLPATHEKTADFIFFPYSLDPLYHHLGHQAFIDFLCKLPGFRNNAHKFVFFLQDDIGSRFDIASVIYRVNHDQRKMDSNSITLPYFVDNLYQTSIADMPRYHVNFVGTIVTHVLRAYMLIPFLEKEKLPRYSLLLEKFDDLISNRKNHEIYQTIMTDAMSEVQGLFPLVTASHGIKYFIDISVEQFPHLPRQVQNTKRAQMVDMMTQSVATLCPRGFGVQSIRFFETLFAGRIPILISDNYRLPLDHHIDYASLVFKISESDVLKLDDRVADFFRLHTMEDLCQKANAARDVWENYFAPSKISKFIHLTLSEVIKANYQLNKIPGRRE